VPPPAKLSDEEAARLLFKKQGYLGPKGPETATPPATGTPRSGDVPVRIKQTVLPTPAPAQVHLGRSQSTNSVTLRLKQLEAMFTDSAHNELTASMLAGYNTIREVYILACRGQLPVQSRQVGDSDLLPCTRQTKEWHH
jgi:hypothetical protein